MINGCPLKPAAMAVDKKGRLYATWYTAGEKPAGVYFTVSDDGGKTFAKAQALHPEAKVSDHSQVAVGPDGRVYLAWDARIIGSWNNTRACERVRRPGRVSDISVGCGGS
jgi:hypothetical protein